MIKAECYSLMNRVFYEQEVYLLLDLTKLNPALPVNGYAKGNTALFVITLSNAIFQFYRNNIFE
ncbi:hypothetical protein TUM4637_37140 [Shewanella hafniensis]|nr:hypothetical protein TUM4637_37140 [Shewanella hafniensis]